VTRVVRLLSLGRITGFTFGGERRELINPDGSPTARQLLKLNALGLLAAVEPGQVEPLTKAEAAWVLDRALRDEAGEAAA
jgi:hypothetical protein